MLPHRPSPAVLPLRLLSGAGLLALAVITLADRGASRMYAAPWSWLYWCAVLAPVLMLGLRTVVPAPPLRLPARPWVWLLAAAWSVLLAAALASPYRAICLRWSALPLSGLATFLLMHDWLQAAPANRERGARFAAVAAGTLMLASTGYWLADMAGLTRAEIFSSTLFELRNPHPLGHSNYTAGLALLALPWLVAAAFRGRGFFRFAARAGTGLALLVLFTSGSRGGLIGLVALGVTALGGARLGWKRFAGLAALALLAAGVLAFANLRIRAMLGPADPAAAPNLSTVQRQAMLKAGWHLGLDRPLLGWGLNTTPLAYPRYRATLDGGAEDVLQLHSTLLEIWAGLGTAGLLLAGGFVCLCARGRARSPLAAATLAGYGVFALTDYQLDVPVFVFACAALAARLADSAPAPATGRGRLGLGLSALVAAGVIAALGARDRTPYLNTEALALARDPAQHDRAVALLNESLLLNPDQEMAHFNLGWLLLVTAPADAERHFRAAAQLVPDKGGVYFGLGVARLNQGQPDGAARAFALECLNDPRFLASPWWTVPAIAAQRAATRSDFIQLAGEAGAMLPPGTWAAGQDRLLLGLAPRLGEVSAGREKNYRRERLGYPVLTRNLDLAPPVDLFDVREDPRFAASVPFALPPKGWLPSPLLLKLLDAGGRSGQQ